MSLSKRTDSLVIGGGIGGLSAAIRLASRGHRVLLCEKNSHTGGKCDFCEKDGFHFDLGPSVLTLPFVLDEVFRLVGKDRRDYLEIEAVEPGCSYFFGDGSRFDAPGMFDDFEQAIADNFPSEIDGFRRFRAHVSRLWEVSGPAFLFHPPGWATLRSIPWQRALRGMLDFMPGRMEPRLRRYFRDPRLIQLFARFATYNGSDPYRTPAIFNVVAHAELAFGSWRCRGGMYALIQALERLARDLGVEIQTQTEIERVQFDSNGQVTGVLMGDGSEKPVNAVVCNQDAAQARVGSLLEDHPNSAKWRRSIGKREASSSGFVLLAAMKRRHPDLSCHNVFFPREYRAEFDSLFHNPGPLEDPTLYISRPAASEPNLAPPGKEGWFVLVNAPSLQKFGDWSESEYAEKIVTQIESRYPQAIGGIEWTLFHGPTFYRDTYRSWHGSLYGLSSNPLRQAFLRFPNRDRRSKGLFFCGGSAHPGGGIPLTLMSGTFAADACCKFLGE